jgi:uncharacterized protein (TIGR03083 family)
MPRLRAPLLWVDDRAEEEPPATAVATRIDSVVVRLLRVHPDTFGQAVGDELMYWSRYPRGRGFQAWVAGQEVKAELLDPAGGAVVDHAEGHTPATILDKIRETFDQAFEAIRTTSPDTIGPGFFGPMRLDEFVATRLVETQVHGMDLTDALGVPPLPMPRVTTMAAEVLDEVLARRAVPGRPADLEGDDLAFIRAASGRGEHPDPRLPVVG